MTALSPPARMRALAALALTAAALTVVVIAASAYLRHVQAGLACADWPSCYARVDAVARAGGTDLARAVHRVSALGVSLALLAMLALAWRAPDARRWSGMALAIAAGLAALGLATAGARLPAIGLANLLGGFALLAALAAAQARAAGAASIAPQARTLARGVLALAFAQAALGGLISTQSALLACPSFPGCDAAALQGFVSGASWDPWRTPVEIDGRLVAPGGAAGLHLAHRATGILLALLAMTLVVKLWRPRGELAVFVVAAVATGIGAGIAAALVPSALGITVLHNGAAALLVALVARAAVADVER